MLKHLEKILIQKINENEQYEIEYNENYIEPLINLLKELGLDDITLETEIDADGDEVPSCGIFIDYKKNKFVHYDVEDPGRMTHNYTNISPIEYITLIIDYLNQEKEAKHIKIKSLKSELQKIIEKL